MHDFMLPDSCEVMVVDDDFRTRLFARSTLEAAQFRVSEAANGAEALQLLNKHTPDLILLDVLMPGLDGFETCQAIRHHPTASDIPVLMMTAMDDLETLGKAYQAGATDFTSKPINWSFLPPRISFIIRYAHTIKALKKSEQDLRLAKEAAESASLAKTNFLATMSHEIRTPLNALKGNLELLSSVQLNGQQREYLADCMTASNILMQVLNDVLDFSKIEAGKLCLSQEAISVKAIARQLARIFTPSAQQKGLILKLKLGANLPGHILGDRLRICQIISNLLSNAIKFTQKGEVSLEMQYEAATSAGGTELLRIVVHDTGVGIPEDQFDKIFESFKQLENFGVRKFSGTGLGLAICKRLINLMGGDIVVKSQPGLGSTFCVLLPAVTSIPPQESDQKNEGHGATYAVLFADDDPLSRKMMTALFEGVGYEITVVENGSQLIELLKQKDFDVVLTDISMPDISGLEVAKIVRSGEQQSINPKIPIIALTAHAFPQDREKFLAAGIDALTVKPIDFESLLKQIEAVLQASFESSTSVS